MKTDLYLSPKFAYHLSRIGILTPLVHAFRQFRSNENYPFELEQKRIIKQSLFKALVEHYKGKEVDIDTILEKAEELSDRIY